MIDKVVIKNWKRFDHVEFDLGRKHMVLVGPNNSGKTSFLQAIAAWGFALDRWRRINQDLNKRNGWVKVPITTDQFTPVSVRAFDSLWRDRVAARGVEIEVRAGIQRVGIEFEADLRSPFQMFVRPTDGTSAAAIAALSAKTLFVPSMSGMLVEEPVLMRPKIEQMLGRNRPGEVLRNLVANVAEDATAWQRLVAAVRDLFGVELLEPDVSGADIVADYRHVSGSGAAVGKARFDLASGGSGFQQVVMLLACLERQPGSLLLLDEPDAHLHVFLQERIVEVLRAAAARTRSTLVIATHSEVVVDSVEFEEVCVLMEQPSRLADAAGLATLKDALRVIDHNDLAKAREAKGILYLEDYTDLAILREWARVLNHPAQSVLGPHVYWRKIAADTGHKRAGITAADHFAALQLARPGYPGLQIVDGDSKVEGPTDRVFGTPPKVRWARYEVESYLLHPAALERFVAGVVPDFGEGQRAALRSAMAEVLTRAFLEDPLQAKGPVATVLRATKARTDLLPPILDAAGLIAFDYRRFDEIAACMRPEEIHPEVQQKLDAICAAFGIPLPPPAPAAGGTP